MQLRTLTCYHVPIYTKYMKKYTVLLDMLTVVDSRMHTMHIHTTEQAYYVGKSGAIVNKLLNTHFFGTWYQQTPLIIM